MATFNPDIKDRNEPNYLGYSKGVDVPSAIRQQGIQPTSIEPKGARYEFQPFKGPAYEGPTHVDKSGYYAGLAEGYRAQGEGEAKGAALKAEAVETKALGDLIEGGVKLAGMAINEADFMIKKGLEDTVYNAVDREREAFTSGLEKTAGLAILTPKEEDTREKPDAVKNVAERASTLRQSADGGHISQTQYLLRLKDMARELRTKYPAYRDFIDKEIASVSGVDPANAYMKSLMSDINAYNSAARSKADKDLAFMKQHLGKVPGMDKYVTDYTSGKAVNMNQVYKDVHDWNIQEELIKRKEQAYNLEEKASASRARQAEDVLDSKVNAEIVNKFKEVEYAGGYKTPDQVVELIQKQARGELKLDPTQLQQLGTLLESQIADMSNRTYELANKPQSDGTTLAQNFKSDNDLKSFISNKFEPYRYYVRLITDEKLGLANEVSRTMKAAQETTTYQFLQTPQGERTRRLKVFDDLLPNFSKSDLAATFFQTPGLQKDIQTFVNGQNVDAVVQPDLRKSGTPVTLKDNINKTQDAGVNDPKAYNSLLNPVQILTDPKASIMAKRNVVDYLFHPNNKAVINKFQSDYVNKQGQLVPGKYSVFSRLTAPEISAEVKALAKTDPIEAAKYLNWTGSEFGILFREEIANIAQASSKDINVEWNDKTLQFDYKKGTAKPSLIPGQFALVQDSISRVNWGLRSLSSSMDAVPDIDKNKVILDLLGKLGYGAKPEEVSIYRRMWDAVNRVVNPPKELFGE